MKKRVMLILSCLFLSLGFIVAQTTRIAGTVVDSNGEPVISASVVVKGTTVGTVTDLDGKFSINVPEGRNTLVFTLVGMKTLELKMSQDMRVVMENDEHVLQDVVITALGVARDKKTLGYSVSSIKGDDIANSKVLNPMSALQGKVSGVEVSSSGTPGGTQNVTIRGFNSFENNQPLYVVDGIPLTNKQNQSGSISGGVNTLNSQADFGSGINALNPNDIESITVLKGSAASALYGSRAAQGVIMITTKSGKDTNGKLRIEYNGGITLQQIGRLPDEQTMFGQGWSADRALDENGNWGARFDGKDRVWGNVVDNSQKLKPYVYLKDRIRDFYDMGFGYENSLSLSGGTAQTLYHLSVSQNYLDGPIPTNTDSYNRFTVASNASHKAGKLLISSSFNASVEKNRVSPTGQDNSIYRSLSEIATDISIVDLKDYNDKFNNLDNYFTPYGLNPYFILDAKEAIQRKYKFFGKVQLDYDLLSNLKLTYRFGGDYETATADMHFDAVSFSDGSINAARKGPASPGSYSQDKRDYLQVNHDYFATFNDRFDDFSMNVIAGGNANEQKETRLYGSISSIDVPGFYHLSNTLTPAVAEQNSERYRILGAYVNADFGYQDYLYLTLTARNDWSSALPKENNSFFYPAAMLSFIVTDFMKQKNINTGPLDFVKTRLSYGRTGKDTRPYRVFNRFLAATATNPGFPEIDDLKFPLGGVNAYTISNRAGNPNLKPELTDEFEIGFESSFFNQRVGVDFSYYNKLTKGLIARMLIDPLTGYTEQYANIGDVRNSGIELSLSLVPVKTKDFQWNIMYNFTKNNNKVEKLIVPEVSLSGLGGMGIYAIEGKPLGQFKSQKAMTVDYNGVESIVVDGVGNPQPTPDDVYLNKDINEKFRMGLTNTFTWKDFSLSATLDFRYGGYIYSYTKDYMHWIGSGPETAYNDRNPFIIPNSVVSNGDGTYSENTTPVDPTGLHTFYSNGGFQYTDFAVIDRSYLKLRNVSLAYQLPKKVCEMLRVSSLRLSATASNILLWTPKENMYIDPEITTWGSDISSKVGEFASTPPYQSYVFGLQLSF
ncbi:SusC/RagA family TonB-linked outer membrane protein [Dysgonomonas termitidis]|uniref:SusC/RagA family TonB-linked outer membrane protein n=1 Tax=Dysgonomonas termitidis TaxID=1516126 RepID=A0ABV9KWW4_9BACT